jgi:acetoin utilization protein AcuB
MKSASITAYMTRHPHSVAREQTVAQARLLMTKYGVRHLPVLDDGRIVGLVSEHDLLLIERLKDVDPTKATVEQAMSKEPYIVASTKPLGQVVGEMAAHKYESAIVVEGTQIVGVFTTVDALRAFGDTQMWEERHPS